MTCFICWFPSVPDLSEYRVWLGVSDIREGAPDLSKKQEVSISHVICGPEGSSLVLVRLSQWVRWKMCKNEEIFESVVYMMLILPSTFFVFINICRPARPADNVHTIQLPVAGCSIPEGRLCKMYGWGETKGTHVLYSTLTRAVTRFHSISFIIHFFFPAA